MHSDVPPDAAGSGLYGWLLAMLGQDVGFPVPQGGAGELARALGSRLTKAGGTVQASTKVTRIQVVAGRATAVTTEGGDMIRARHAVLADVSAPALYAGLLDPSVVPVRLLRDLDRFEWDGATLKVNWALEHPIPWRDSNAHGAGTVHLGVDVSGFVDFAADLSVGRMPSRPFVVCGQMTTADSSRSPMGTESAWAYTHLPRRRAASGDELEQHVALIESTFESLAPGFIDSQLARSIQTPTLLNGADANLDGGAINGGTAQLHQQLIFRPTPGLGRAETPIENLYLASAAAHPGGGVHGACGWNAARAALAMRGPAGSLRRRLTKTAWSRLLAGTPTRCGTRG
jgi:phytoene dehydrogenase-like protein